MLKKELGTLLIRSKKFEIETVRLLMRFLDWMLILPKELEHDYLETIETMMKEEKTMFIPGWLQDSFDEGLAVGMKTGMEKGLKQGLKQGEIKLIQLLRHQLQSRFGHIPETFLRKIKTANESQILIWSMRILTARTLEDVFEEI